MARSRSVSRVRRRTAALALLLAAAPSAACSGDAAADTLTVAVVPKGTGNDFWNSVHAGALQAGAELGVAIRWQAPETEGDRQQQIQLLQSLVSSGVDGIVLAPVDEHALQGVVADAGAAGVPTVVIDSGLGGDAHTAFVATDNRAGGELAGRRLAEVLGGQGRVVMLRFQQGSASTTAREAGFLAAIGEHDGVVVVSDNQYAADAEAARQTAESLLVAHPDIDGVFCPNESTTHGFLKALQAAGKAGQVRFVGFDSSAPLLEGLRQGHLDGLVLQDPVTMAAVGVRTMVAHLRGETVPAVVTTELALATPDNCDEPRIHALLEPDLSILGR